MNTYPYAGHSKPTESRFTMVNHILPHRASAQNFFPILFDLVLQSRVELVSIQCFIVPKNSLVLIMVRCAYGTIGFVRISWASKSRKTRGWVDDRGGLMAGRYFWRPAVGFCFLPSVLRQPSIHPRDFHYESFTTTD